MRSRGLVISRYQQKFQKYRQMGMNGTTARKKAWDETFGMEIQTVEETDIPKPTDGVEEVAVEEIDPDGTVAVREFRIG